MLVVDEDGTARRLNVQGLRRQGYEVGIAEDGHAAWLELQTNRYHLVITEHELPGLSGLGLIKKLRQANMRLPVIIAITTMPGWQSSAYPWLLHANRIFKPYTVTSLAGLVKNVLHTTNPLAMELRQQQMDPASRQSAVAS